MSKKEYKHPVWMDRVAYIIMGLLIGLLVGGTIQTVEMNKRINKLKSRAVTVAQLRDWANTSELAAKKLKARSINRIALEIAAKGMRMSIIRIERGDGFSRYLEEKANDSN